MFVCVLDEHLNSPKNGRKEEKEGIVEEDLWPLWLFWLSKNSLRRLFQSYERDLLGLESLF